MTPENKETITPEEKETSHAQASKHVIISKEKTTVKPINTFITIPSLPKPLERLRDLAYNLRWAWDHDAILLFRQLDSDLWEETGHNPVLMLGMIDQARLEAAAADEGFLAQLDRIADTFSVLDLAGNEATVRPVSEPALAKRTGR